MRAHCFWKHIILDVFNLKLINNRRHEKTIQNLVLILSEMERDREDMENSITMFVSQCVLRHDYIYTRDGVMV